MAGLEQGKDHGPAEWTRGTRLGTARHGGARQGLSKARDGAGHGLARHGAAGPGLARHGEAGPGKDHGRMRGKDRGQARPGRARRGLSKARIKGANAQI
jgi:hypothetical protein